MHFALENIGFCLPAGEAGVRRLVIGVGKTAVFPIRTVAGRLGMGDCWEKKQGLLQLPQ